MFHPCRNGETVKSPMVYYTHDSDVFVCTCLYSGLWQGAPLPGTQGGSDLCSHSVKGFVRGFSLLTWLSLESSPATSMHWSIPSICGSSPNPSVVSRSSFQPEVPKHGLFTYYPRNLAFCQNLLICSSFYFQSFSVIASSLH